MSKKKETIKTGRVIRNSANGVTRLLIDFAFYTLVILAVIRFSQYGYNFCYQLFGSVAVDKEGEGNEVEFFIQSGDSTKEVAAKLDKLSLPYAPLYISTCFQSMALGMVRTRVEDAMGVFHSLGRRSSAR